MNSNVSRAESIARFVICIYTFLTCFNHFYTFNKLLANFVLFPAKHFRHTFFYRKISQKFFTPGKIKYFVNGRNCNIYNYSKPQTKWRITLHCNYGNNFEGRNYFSFLTGSTLQFVNTGLDTAYLVLRYSILKMVHRS